MAYITQEMKKELAPAIKNVFKKYGLKGSISIRNHHQLCVTITSGPVDFIGDANRSNKERTERMGLPFHAIEGSYQANAYRASNDNSLSETCLEELRQAMRGEIWYDKSDSMTDYFDTAYYLAIDIGRFDKPYQLTA